MFSFVFRVVLCIILLPIIILYISGSSSDIFAADGYASLFIIIAVVACGLNGFVGVRNGI